MVRARFCTIVRSRGFCWFIIRGIAVGETVRHDEVHHVILRESLELAEGGRAGGERQFERGDSLWRSDPADGCS